jgi:predicted HTH transcriptional regulator
LIENGENEYVEFKSSIRWDYKQNSVNTSLESVIAKTIAGFLNYQGGQLIIGVDDDRMILGLEKDFLTLKKKNVDGFELKLTEIINNKIGKEVRHLIHLIFEEVDGKTICLVDIEKSPKAVYVVTDGKNAEFYLRSGNSTEPLDIRQATEYSKNHWK